MRETHGGHATLHFWLHQTHTHTQRHIVISNMLTNKSMSARVSEKKHTHMTHTRQGSPRGPPASSCTSSAAVHHPHAPRTAARRNIYHGCPVRFGRRRFPVSPFRRFAVLALRSFYYVSHLLFCRSSQAAVSAIRFSVPRAAPSHNRTVSRSALTRLPACKPKKESKKEQQKRRTLQRGLRYCSPEMLPASLPREALKTKYRTVQYSTVQYSTAQYSTAQHSTVQYSTVQHSTEEYRRVQKSTEEYRRVQKSTEEYRRVQKSTEEYRKSTEEYRRVQYSTVQDRTGQDSTA